MNLNEFIELDLRLPTHAQKNAHGWGTQRKSPERKSIAEEVVDFAVEGVDLLLEVGNGGFQQRDTVFLG